MLASPSVLATRSGLDLLEPIAEEFQIPAMADLPLRAQYIENKPGGREALTEHLEKVIGDIVPEPGDNHVLLAQLDIRDTWTTNYDPLIETADSNLTVIKRDVDLVDRAGRQQRLYKMHGSIPSDATGPDGRRDQLVLSRNDYEGYEQAHPRLWRLLQAQFLTSSFLFLGFSMTDPNFEAVFKIARLVTADKLMPHYAIMKRDNTDDGMFDLRSDDLRQAGVELIEVDDFDEITELLQKLLARSRPARLFVSGSARTPQDADSTGASTYPTAASNEELDGFAKALGRRLAAEGIPSIVAAGELGAKVGYCFLSRLNEYDPSRFLLIRRRSNEKVGPPSLRQGQMHFIGEEPKILRTAALKHVRAVVVLGGGPGTKSEANQALDLGMTVIPIAYTGGAAHKVWQSMTEELQDHHAGQRPIDPQQFKDLGSADSDTAMRAATELIRIGLFLPTGDSP